MIRTSLSMVFLLGSVISAAAAGFPCEKFEKSADGDWAAKEPVQILGPNGRLDFTPGQTYRVGQSMAGLDVAKLLEANCAKK